jgi:5-methylcytosine-specific restriction endonuclease McrA
MAVLLVQTTGDLCAGHEISATGSQADRCRYPLAYHHANWSRQGAPLLDLLGAVIDHIEAFSTGGASDIENLATACNKCNGRKGNGASE